MEATLIPILIKNRQKTDLGRNLEEQFEEVASLIRTSILSNQDFPDSFYNAFNQIFLLRLEAHTYLKTHHIYNAELNEASEQFTTHIQSMSGQSSESIDFWVENTLFVLRTLKKVAAKSANAVILKPLKNIEGQHCTSYDNFKNYLISTYKNFGKETQEHIVDFFHASLMVDACLIAVHLIVEEKLASKLSENKIDKLSELMVENAQTYGGRAFGLGILSRENILNRLKLASEDSSLILA